MARTVQLSELRARVRDRADIEGATGFISDARLTEYINGSIASLYNIIIDVQGQDYFLSQATISLPSAAISPGLYALPSDFFMLRRVEWVDGDVRTEIHPISMHELRELDTSVVGSPRAYYRDGYLYASRLSGYRLGGTVASATGVYTGHIRFPKNWSGTVELYYVPHAIVLVDDTDVFDGFNGFEEWVVLDAAIKVAQKEERDPSDLLAARAAEENRLRSMASSRDLSFPETIAEVEDYD